jgi:hypothetical protein
MKIFNLKQGQAHFSGDLFKEIIKEGLVQTPKEQITTGIESYINECLIPIVARKNPKFIEYVDLYGKANNLQGNAFLFAHGSSNGEWNYHDGKKEKPVQKWINSMDGKFAGLWLFSCNPGHHTPKSKKSVILLSDRDIGLSHIVDNSIFSLWVPKIGDVNSYVIDYEVQSLKQGEK